MRATVALMHRDQVSPVLWVGSVLMSTFLPIIIFPRKASKRHKSAPHLTSTPDSSVHLPLTIRDKKSESSASPLCLLTGYKISESELVTALPDPVEGFGNYSSLPHLSLANADFVRWPDIPQTTVRTPC